MIDHFAQRAQERGITSVCPRVLWHVLRRKVARGCLEHVLTRPDGRFFRFHLKEGRFYVVTGVDRCDPITVFTQQMMRGKKFATKKQRKGQGR